MNFSMVCCKIDGCWIIFLGNYLLVCNFLYFRFGINDLIGEIYNIEVLDREKISEYYIIVEVKDGGGFRIIVELNVKVIDINDNKSFFIREVYFVFFKEGVILFVREFKLEVSIIIYCWINIFCL